jgi:CBS domain-containing protein
MNVSMELILDRINQAEKFDEMRCLRDQAHEMFQEHLLFSHSLELHASINQFHDAFISRTVFLAEKQMEGEGAGSPPVPYAFMLFGSGGRSEQTLWSDQDNGFIYEDSSHHSQEELEQYFIQLITYILQGLDVLGYPPCQGNVVSSNPKWRKPYSHYIEMMLEWFGEPSWENIRYLLIMADLRGVYGDSNLVERMMNEFYRYVEEHPPILQSMLSNTLHHKASLGLFGNLITERYGEDAGGVDIKYGAYIPIVNGIRLLAIQSGIKASSTLDRLQLLMNGKWIDNQQGEEWKRAFTIALKLRDATPFQVEDGLYTTRGKLAASQLTRETRLELKHCLRAGMELQKYVKKTIETLLEKKG